MKPFNKSIYLAGAISYFYNTDQPERATKWRDKVEEYFEISKNRVKDVMDKE